ncbi:MAG TPA: HIT domain-containing protein [Acidiferrobacteraceae bacterium]|nr:HIT domain-containing protein [Acidiferrobacteraceae bacterium]
MMGGRWVARVLGFGAVFGLGIGVGAYLFHDTRPRRLLPTHPCHGIACYGLPAVAGLAASVGIRFAPHMLPLEIGENAHCLAMKNPDPDAPIDLVVIPKKDIKGIGRLTAGDMPYIEDCLALVGQLVRSHHLKAYKVLINGVGYQKVRYLHFHVLAR